MLASPNPHPSSSFPTNLWNGEDGLGISFLLVFLLIRVIGDPSSESSVDGVPQLAKFLDAPLLGSSHLPRKLLLLSVRNRQNDLFVRLRIFENIKTVDFLPDCSRAKTDSLPKERLRAEAGESSPRDSSSFRVLARNSETIEERLSRRDLFDGCEKTSPPCRRSRVLFSSEER